MRTKLADDQHPPNHSRRRRLPSGRHVLGGCRHAAGRGRHAPGHGGAAAHLSGLCAVPGRTRLPRHHVRLPRYRRIPAEDLARLCRPHARLDAARCGRRDALGAGALSGAAATGRGAFSGWSRHRHVRCGLGVGRCGAGGVPYRQLALHPPAGRALACRADPARCRPGTGTVDWLCARQTHGPGRRPAGWRCHRMGRVGWHAALLLR